MTSIPSAIFVSRPQAALAVVTKDVRPDPMGQLSSEEIAELATNAQGLQVENPIPGEVLQRMTEAGKLTSSDQDSLANLARQARTQHRTLHQRIREGDKSVAGALADLHVFLDQYQRCQDNGEFRIYRQAVGQLAGGTPADNPVAAALYQGLDETTQGIEVVTKSYNSMVAGKHPLHLGGNQVEVLVRGSIWQKKLALLEGAIQSARAGQPQEIDLQYHELSNRSFLEKVAQAAKAGCPVRVNMDPGRLEKEPESRSFDASELPRKMRNLFELLSTTAGTDSAVTLFPVAEKLGNTENLMHRKLFRVGDSVLLGGVNASASSGDNVDSAMLIQGPAAHKLVEIFRRDLAESAEADLKDIYGTRQLSTLQAANAVLGPAGLVALWENIHFLDRGSFPTLAPTPAEQIAAHGEDMARLVQLEDLNGDGRSDLQDLRVFLERGLEPGNYLHVTPEGADKLLKMLGSAVQRTGETGNRERAGRVSEADGSVKGSSSLTLADLPADRQAVLLQAIATAEEFLYLPDFMITPAVAGAVAERMAEVPGLDVRVVADAGVYPDGHTPNDLGMRTLEDAGAQTRWSLLMAPISGQDRKLHQKAVITEKMAMLGSTNLSRKGLAENWELSGLLYFQEGDDSNRTRLVEDFQRTFEEEAIDLSSRTIATARLDGLQARDKHVRIEEARYGVTRDILRAIGAYEIASTQVLTRLADETPGVREAAAGLQVQGLPRGYALQQALRDALGPEKLVGELRKTTAYADLLRLRRGERLEGSFTEELAS